MNNKEKIGNITINFPNENSALFYIFQDLAELMGFEFQSDAVKKLKSELKQTDIKPKPNIDYESDFTSIRTSNPETIFKVVKLLNSLSIKNYQTDFDNRNWNDLYKKLLTWERPKPQEWNVGDVFSIKLKPDHYVFGQVLVKEKFQKTFVLFDLKSKIQDLDTDSLKKANPLTILHLRGHKLNDRTWKVIGNLNELLTDPNGGPWKDNYGQTGTDGHFESIANYYWFGQNNWKNENDLKKLIMKKKSVIDKIKNWW